jgi:hypothetical protein
MAGDENYSFENWKKRMPKIMKAAQLQKQGSAEAGTSSLALAPPPELPSGGGKVKPGLSSLARHAQVSLKCSNSVDKDKVSVKTKLRKAL